MPAFPLERALTKSRGANHTLTQAFFFGSNRAFETLNCFAITESTNVWLLGPVHPSSCFLAVWMQGVMSDTFTRTLRPLRLPSSKGVMEAMSTIRGMFTRLAAVGTKRMPWLSPGLHLSSRIRDSPRAGGSSALVSGFGLFLA